jgi:hypothetical protein
VREGDTLYLLLLALSSLRSTAAAHLPSNPLNWVHPLDTVLGTCPTLAGSAVYNRLGSLRALVSLCFLPNPCTHGVW